MEERMGFARMTALSAAAALAGASGLYAMTPAGAEAEQGRRVVIEREGDGPDRVIVREGQDDEGTRGGRRVVIRKAGGDDGPGLEVFHAGGSRVGIVIRDVETADVAKEKLAGAAGAIVTEVQKGSAAEKAGVKSGDVVTAFDGERVRSARQLERLVGETPAGRTVKMAVSRAGAAVNVDVTPEAPKMAELFVPGGDEILRWKQAPVLPGGRGLEPGERPRVHIEPFRFEMPEGRGFEFGEGFPFAATVGRGRLGVRVQDLTDELAGYFGVKGGVLVSGVEADTPAAKAGVKAGDVITAVNGNQITDPSELRREVAKVDDGQSADLSVTRDKKTLSLKVEVKAAEKPAERKLRRSL
jgi:serine protease Do